MISNANGAPCAVWGVLNVTPDSFSDGGAYLQLPHAVERGLEMMRQGASVVDVGGESSRPKGPVYGPGAAPVDLAEELRRVVPVVERLAAQGVTCSIDTTKAQVAREALRAGATLVNDVSCGSSEALLDVVAQNNAELVLMHNRGRGEVTAEHTRYESVVDEVLDELLQARDRAVCLGVPKERIWLDPGLGFAKTASQSACLLRHVARFVETGQRVLIGASRKAFVAELAKVDEGPTPTVDARMGGSVAAAVIAALAGVHAVRVHDVGITAQAVRVAQRLVGASAC